MQISEYKYEDIISKSGDTFSIEGDTVLDPDF